MSSLGIIWWPYQQHVEIEWENTQYEVFHGKVNNRCPSAMRTERSRHKVEKCFYRFTLELAEVEQFKADLACDNLAIESDYCSGSAAQIINGYTYTEISLIESRTPLWLGQALIEKADSYEFIAPEGYSLSKEQLKSWSFLLHEMQHFFKIIGFIVVLGVTLNSLDGHFFRRL